MRKDRKEVKARQSLKIQAPLPGPCRMLQWDASWCLSLTWKRLPVVWSPWSCFATVYVPWQGDPQGGGARETAAISSSQLWPPEVLLEGVHV